MATPAFPVLNPDYERMARALFEAQPFMRHIGAQLVSIAPGRCEMQVPYRAELTQQDGFFHGGLIAALADNAAGAAGYSLLAADRAALTVEFKVNIMAPGRGERLVARGQVVRSGKTLTVCRAEVLAVADGEEKACATGLMTLMSVPR
jgi:uncharacterized protein (TIGR00369 family)